MEEQIVLSQYLKRSPLSFGTLSFWILFNSTEFLIWLVENSSWLEQSGMTFRLFTYGTFEIKMDCFAQILPLELWSISNFEVFFVRQKAFVENMCLASVDTMFQLFRTRANFLTSIFGQILQIAIDVDHTNREAIYIQLHKKHALAGVFGMCDRYRFNQNTTPSVFCLA